MSPKDLAKHSDVVIMMLGYPKDVEEMAIGEEGIVKEMREGALLVDHTTSQPNLAKRIYEECVKRKVRAVDAPVSGGDIGAKEGKD